MEKRKMERKMRSHDDGGFRDTDGETLVREDDASIHVQLISNVDVLSQH